MSASSHIVVVDCNSGKTIGDIVFSNMSNYECYSIDWSIVSNTVRNHMAAAIGNTNIMMASRVVIGDDSTADRCVGNVILAYNSADSCLNINVRMHFDIPKHSYNVVYILFSKLIKDIYGVFDTSCVKYS